MTTEKVWFNDPVELFKQKNILKFWPNTSQSATERINSATRFILYAAAIMYVMRRDVRIIALAMMVIAVIFILYKGNMVSESTVKPVYSNEYNYSPDCQLPTDDNPMSNFLVGDDINKPPACFYPTVRDQVKTKLDDTIQYDCGRSRCAMPDIQQRAAARQFVSNPVTTIVGDQTSFAEWCYGSKNKSLCRNDPTQCDPNSRGAQLGPFTGVGSDGNVRAGLF
jgi:hypothetical protein